MEIKDLLRQLLKDNEEIYSLVAKVVSVDEAKRVCKVEPLDGSASIFNVRLQSSVSSEIGLVIFPALESEVTVTFLAKELAYVSQTNKLEKILLNIGNFSLFIDKENVNENVKNKNLDTEEHSVKSKNTTFTIESIFSIISQQQIKMEAQSYLLKATNVGIEGLTSILGNTSIEGAFSVLGTTTLTGAATVTGAATLSGGVAVSGGATVAGGMSLDGGANGGVPLSVPLKEKINTIEEDLNDLKTVLAAWTPVAGDGGGALKTAISTYASQNLNITGISEISNPNFKQ